PAVDAAVATCPRCSGASRQQGGLLLSPRRPAEANGDDRMNCHEYATTSTADAADLVVFDRRARTPIGRRTRRYCRYDLARATGCSRMPSADPAGLELRGHPGFHGGKPHGRPSRPSWRNRHVPGAVFHYAGEVEIAGIG